jgi:hypothetical protein
MNLDTAVDLNPKSEVGSTEGSKGYEGTGAPKNSGEEFQPVAPLFSSLSSVNESRRSGPGERAAKVAIPSFSLLASVSLPRLHHRKNEHDFSTGANRECREFSLIPLRRRVQFPRSKPRRLDRYRHEQLETNSLV